MLPVCTGTVLLVRTRPSSSYSHSTTTTIDLVVVLVGPATGTHFTGTMVHILDNLSSKHCSDLQKLSLICYMPMWQNKSLVDTKKAIEKYLTYFRNIRKNRNRGVKNICGIPARTLLDRLLYVHR